MVASSEEVENEEYVQRAGGQAAMILCNAAPNYRDPDLNVRVAYRFDFQVALKGARPWHDRGLHRSFSVSMNEDDESSLPGGLPLFTYFPASEAGRDDDTTYRIRVGVYKQRYRRNTSMFGEHTEHVPVWSDYLVLTMMPKSCAAIYSWASEPAPSFREAAALLSGDRMDTIIPLPGRARGALGSRAVLRFEMTSWI